LKISIIIVNYNTAKYLESCIRSVVYFEDKFDLEFIIVDNKSEDNSEDIINKLISEYKNVKGIFLDSNRGFAYANNRGVEISDGDYVLILNPDVIFTECVFEKLIALHQARKPGVLGVKLSGEDNIFQHKYYQKYPSVIQYTLFYSIFSKPFIKSEYFLNKFLYNKINTSGDEVISVPQIPGAFMFFKSEIYRKYNGFKENYFLFFEDVDLCFRINKKHELLIANLKVLHTGASSMFLNTDDKTYGYFIISLLKFFKFNYNIFDYNFLKIFILENCIMKIILEYFRKLFGKSNPGIISVHKYILKNLNSR
jgi:GT2 family glycosyltransferase